MRFLVLAPIKTDTTASRCHLLVVKFHKPVFKFNMHVANTTRLLLIPHARCKFHALAFLLCAPVVNATRPLYWWHAWNSSCPAIKTTRFFPPQKLGLRPHARIECHSPVLNATRPFWHNTRPFMEKKSLLLGGNPVVLNEVSGFGPHKNWHNR